MELPLIMRLVVAVEPPLSAGDTPHGEVRVLPFRGGTFETVGTPGGAVTGTVLPGGTDWQTVRRDGALEIRAHYMLESDDGERIEVVSEGVRSAPAEVLERLAAGDPVDPSEYYFRTHIRFATAAERFADLNDVLAVSVGRRRPDGVELDVYAIP